ADAELARQRLAERRGTRSIELVAAHDADGLRDLARRPAVRNARDDDLVGGLGVGDPRKENADGADEWGDGATRRQLSPHEWFPAFREVRRANDAPPRAVPIRRRRPTSERQETKGGPRAGGRSGREEIERTSAGKGET